MEFKGKDYFSGLNRFMAITSKGRDSISGIYTIEKYD